MRLLVVGGSTFGLTVAEIAQRTGRFQIDGFVDDSPASLSTKCGLPYWGPTEKLSLDSVANRKIVIAVGANHDRSKLFERIIGVGLRPSLVNVVDPSAILLGDVSIGLGNIIFPGAIISPRTTLGNGVVINAHCFIGAMCKIRNFTNICPGVAIGSSTCIGDKSYIGMRASVIHGVEIGPEIVIGAGATVISNLIESGTYAGIPARRIS